MDIDHSCYSSSTHLSAEIDSLGEFQHAYRENFTVGGGTVHFQYALCDHLGNTVVLFEDKDGNGAINSEYDYYDPSIGRFTGVDPLAEKYPHLSVYNYAGNSPISNIDLWGLQRVYYLNSFNKKNSLEAYSFQRQTTGGNKFKKVLNNQTKYDIAYSSSNSSWSLFSGPIKTKDEFYQKLKTSRAANELFSDDYYEVLSIIGNMDPGKELLLIGIDNNGVAKNCDLNNVTEMAQSLNHEEYHARRYLETGEEARVRDHKEYNGYPGPFSPDSKDLETKPEKYKGTKALEQYEEIKDIGNDSGL